MPLLAAKPPPPPAPRFMSAPTQSRRVKIIDRTADLLIRASGAGIIVIVTLIFVFLGLETLPLFRGARQEVVFQDKLPGSPAAGQMLALGVDEYESHLYYVDAAAGVVRFFDVLDRRSVRDFPLKSLGAARVTAAYRTPSHDVLVIGASDGRIIIVRPVFSVVYGADGKREVKPGLREVATIAAVDAHAIVRVHARQNSAGDYFFAAANEEQRVLTGKFVEGEPNEPPQFVGGQLDGRIVALAGDHDGDRLLVATDARKLYQYYLADNRETAYRVHELRANATALDFIIGDVSVVLGFADGRVESWFGVRENETDTLKPFHRIHEFERIPARVTWLQPSARDKGFVAGGADGTIKLNFTTSERTLLTSTLGEEVVRLAYSPKLTAVVALGADGTVRMSRIENPHPEISFRTLFGKVHYEGYDKPDFIWQSTGGTDDFEGKFSLVPLTVGTLKGAFYGLLFAIPVAVFAALYTSQFMAPVLRTYLKPAIEIMAALPSVVIGFLAGLWLAPRLEGIMVGTLLAAFTIPLVISLGALGWTMLPAATRRRVPAGFELVLVIPLLLLGFWLAQLLGPGVEAALFGGDYRQWVFDGFGEQFEQRNSIVIGIAMGFAVIPIIFTISEDAFSNVPQALKSASYALGASRWQTAARVVLPTASPGVFSAIMIGFGRAVGETMIVLMATGNTPIMSFSPFNGMRTLAANTAVEIPEAPAGGTLYRVLFVSALLLFAITFLCNTAAEIVRQRLRRKYQSL